MVEEPAKVFFSSFFFTFSLKTCISQGNLYLVMVVCCVLIAKQRVFVKAFGFDPSAPAFEWRRMLHFLKVPLLFFCCRNSAALWTLTLFWWNVKISSGIVLFCDEWSLNDIRNEFDMLISTPSLSAGWWTLKTPCCRRVRRREWRMSGRWWPQSL